MSRVRSLASGYRFDDFYVDVPNRQLWRKGELLSLNSKYFDVLQMLLSRKGELVEKQRIFEEVWEGVFVTDAALTQCIKDIRKQLGDDAGSPRYIKTVPKHGYIFIGNAVASGADDSRTPPAVAGTTGRTRPYKFLDYYSEQDSNLFFGREAEAHTVCSQVLTHRSFVLHGRSGVGKTSILRAGLLPLLKGEGHLAFTVRSLTDPVYQMKASLALSLGENPGIENGASLLDLIERVSETRPGRIVVFLLDQFEEFFLLLGPDSRRRFVDALSVLVSREALPVRLLFAIREDFLSELSLFKSAIPEIFHHEYRLTRLSRDQAARAIMGPAVSVGCEFEPDLVERLLEDLSESGSIDPPQLQIVCDNLYDCRDNSGRITIASYEQLGTASRILAGYLERVLNRFDASDLQIAKAVLVTLISIDGRRHVLRPGELEARVKNLGPSNSGSVAALVDELVAARIVRRSRESGETWLELAHDFLTSEVARWITADERALKEARGVIKRAMENYRSHQLIVDADALDLLLPFGVQLGLTAEEADLLAKSVLHRGRPLPEWLLREAQSSRELIEEAAQNHNEDVRLRAVGACLLTRSEGSLDLLRRLALWDEDLGVRKAASIGIAERFPQAVEGLISEGVDARAGLIRRAVSLAIIRDYDRGLLRLRRLSIPARVVVVLGLMWVRLRRGGADIVRSGSGGTMGGAASGVVGGLMLGLGLAAAQRVTALEAAKLVFVLVSLGTFIGAIGALGVSFGMIAARHVAYRHSRWWAVVGAVVGGTILGGVFKLLSIDILTAIFGRNPSGITGAFEGAVVGAGLSLGIVLIEKLRTEAPAWHRVLGGGLGAMCAGILLTVIGGNLFSGSLEIVARSFADSQIRMDPLGPFFGEVRFGQTTQIIFGAIEGLLFGAGTTAGMELLARSAEEELS